MCAKRGVGPLRHGGHPSRAVSEPPRAIDASYDLTPGVHQAIKLCAHLCMLFGVSFKVLGGACEGAPARCNVPSLTFWPGRR
jgi:hypothetical protein